MTTDTSKAADAATNTNVLDLTPPELNADRFLGASAKDGVIDPPAAPAAKPAAKDTNGKTPAAKAPTKEGEGEEGEENQDNKPSKPAQKRIDQAIARQRAAERTRDADRATIAALERRLSAVEAGGATGVDNNKKTATSEEAAPDHTKYEYGELDARYIKDLAKHEARQEFRALNAKNANEQNQASQEAAARERAEKVAEWSEQAPEKYADFEEVVVQGAKDRVWPLSETLGELIFESSVGHDIAYALASDIKEANRIARLPARQQAAWFGREEARLTAEAESSGSEDETKNSGAVAAAKVTQAPAPTAARARGTGNSKPVDASTSDFAAFEALAMSGSK